MDVYWVWLPVFWIHVLSDSDGVSITFSPHDIVTGGEYVQMHESGGNTIITYLTSDDIVLRSTGTFQGIWKFISPA